MVPSLGESVTEATVATWFKKAGDSVTQDEMLCELETDKVSVEVPAPASGILAEILAEEGATVDAKAKLTTSLNRNSDVSDDMREQIRETEDKLDRLREELIRSSSHGGGMR